MTCFSCKYKCSRMSFLRDQAPYFSHHLHPFWLVIKLTVRSCVCSGLFMCSSLIQLFVLFQFLVWTVFFKLLIQHTLSLRIWGLHEQKTSPGRIFLQFWEWKIHYPRTKWAKQNLWTLNLLGRQMTLKEYTMFFVEERLLTKLQQKDNI
jgi:hypothetical protein